jgi:cytochrome c-type biogenesis protein
MVELNLAFVLGVFVAGALTFLAPCTLPLVPVFLGFISGASIGDGNAIDKEARRRILVNTVSYILGFSLVFIAFGVAAGLAGRYLAPARTFLTTVSGAAVIIFGLYLLGAFKFSLFSKAGNPLPVKFGKKRGALASFSLGAAFAAGWSPCVGPVVGSVLLLASTKGTVWTGALLLGVFSVGLGVPFLLTGLFISKATAVLRSIEKHLVWINKISGVLIILLGILLITNNMNLLVSWGYKLFSFIDYRVILKYL